MGDHRTRGVWMSLVCSIVDPVRYPPVSSKMARKSPPNKGFNLKTTYKWTLSIATFDYQRVNPLKEKEALQFQVLPSGKLT